VDALLSVVCAAVGSGAAAAVEAAKHKKRALEPLVVI
jgi:hypothetical protein